MKEMGERRLYGEGKATREDLVWEEEYLNCYGCTSTNTSTLCTREIHPVPIQESTLTGKYYIGWIVRVWSLEATQRDSAFEGGLLLCVLLAATLGGYREKRRRESSERRRYLRRVR